MEDLYILYMNVLESLWVNPSSIWFAEKIVQKRFGNLGTSNFHGQTSDHLRVYKACLHVNFVTDLNWKTHICMHMYVSVDKLPEVYKQFHYGTSHT